eukprot:UN24628
MSTKKIENIFDDILNYLDKKKKTKSTTFYSNFDWIGLDLDHNICKYNQQNLSQLIWENWIDFLVNIKEYSRDLLKWKLDHKWCIRGPWFDYKTGYLIRCKPTDTKSDNVYNSVIVTYGYYGLKKVSIKDTRNAYPKPINLNDNTRFA